MSVSESFLRGGRPSTNSETLNKTLSAAYPHWILVVVPVRQWRHDTRINAITAPSFHLLFGHSPNGDDGGDADKVVAGLHLLHASVQGECGNDTDTLSHVRTVFENTPKHLHPRALTFVVCVSGSTHERLSLCGGKKADWLFERLAEKVLDPACALAPSCGLVRFTEAVKEFSAAYVRLNESGRRGAEHQHDGGIQRHRHFHKPPTMDENTKPHWLTHDLSILGSAPFATLVDDACGWVRTRSGLEDAIDASLPPQGDNEELLKTLSACNPLLWKTRFVEVRKAEKMVLSSSSFSSSALLAGSGGGAATVDSSLLSGVARLKAERDAGREAWRASIGECTTFALPAEGVSAAKAGADTGSRGDNDRSERKNPPAAGGAVTSADDADQRDYRHAFLLQRPYGEKKAIDMDNRDPGPLTPQAIGAEVHLLPDPGDALHVERQLSGEVGAMEFTYEDYLESEGEVFLQLSPVEGIPFDDLDRFFAFLDGDKAISAPKRDLQEQQQREQHEGAAGQMDTVDAEGASIRENHLTARCEGSCSALVYPTVLFRKPTGKNEKLNPMTRSHAQVAVSSPTPRMLARATEALKLMSDHVCDFATLAERLHRHEKRGETEQDASSFSSLQKQQQQQAKVHTGKPGYTLVDLAAVDASVLGPPSRRCGWCMRRRERLLRCGACKEVFYCSKAHQALDWKEGSHKMDCGLFQKGKKLTEEVFMPLVAKMSEDERRARTPGAACAGTIVSFLQSQQQLVPSPFSTEVVVAETAWKALPSTTELHVCVLGIEGGWVADMARRLSHILSQREQGGQSSEHSSTPQPLQRPQLCLTVFVEPPSTGTDPANMSPQTVEAATAAEQEGSHDAGFANNTVLAIQPTAEDGAPFLQVPSTGVVGDLWHVKGSVSEELPNGTTNPDPVGAGESGCEGTGDANSTRNRAAAFAAARRAPVLLRVCNNSFFRAVEGDGEREVAWLKALQGLLYFGPKSGEGLGYLYGSVDTVAQRVAGRVPVRFVDSAYIGAHHSAGALLARLDSRKDVDGLSVRNALQERWEAMTATKKTIAKHSAASDAGSDTEGARKPLVYVNNANFAVAIPSSSPPSPPSQDGAVAATDSTAAAAATVAPFIHSFYFDVPAAPLR